MKEWKLLEFQVMFPVSEIVQLKGYNVNLRAGEMMDPDIEKGLLGQAALFTQKRKEEAGLEAGFETWPVCEVVEWENDPKTQALIASALHEYHIEAVIQSFPSDPRSDLTNFVRP